MSAEITGIGRSLPTQRATRDTQSAPLTNPERAERKEPTTQLGNEKEATLSPRPLARTNEQQSLIEKVLVSRSN